MRPAKPAIMLSDCSQTKEEIQNRIDNEEKLKGNSDKIDPPDYLDNKQVELFNYIKNELEASNLLSNLDVFILAKCAIAISRLQYIEKKVNDNPRLLLVQNPLMSNKKNYDADFFRCCNELSLTPAARAKLGNMKLLDETEKDDPVARALSGDDE